MRPPAPPPHAHSPPYWPTGLHPNPAQPRFSLFTQSPQCDKSGHFCEVRDKSGENRSAIRLGRAQASSE